MEDVNLQNSDFYLAIYDLEAFIKSKERNLSSSLFLPNLCLEWSSKQKFQTSSGYSSDSDEEEAEKSEYLKPLRNFATTLALSSVGDNEPHLTTSDMPRPSENCIGSTYVNEEVAVILISCSNLITTSEELTSILNQLIPNLDNSSLLSIDSLYSISEKGISNKMINSLLSFIMRQTFDFIALSKQQKIEADSNGLSGSSNYFDSSGNWLMQSGYFEFWHGKQSVDLMAELLRLVEVCEREIETIKAGYREFSSKSDSLIIPLLEEQEDWEVQDPEDEISPMAERLPQTLTQHQMLDHLAQKAQIVELKLDRIELLALREARQDPGLPLINDVEIGLTQQRNALQHLKSSFIITGDDLLSQGSHLFDFVIRNNSTNTDVRGDIQSSQTLLMPERNGRISSGDRITSAERQRSRLEESYCKRFVLRWGRGVAFLLLLILLFSLIAVIAVMTFYFLKIF